METTIEALAGPLVMNHMLYVAGSKLSYRCKCGCNVFHVVQNSIQTRGMKTYECNGCGDWYSPAPPDKGEHDGTERD